ncbi:hypothetical protein G9A89_020733 [Geosiphon pyriformis]|nr:hypothetical protein G9A89_020733 [Geosiphon pyriformis]
MNYLTKWPEAKAIQRADAESVAKFVHQDLICRHGYKPVEFKIGDKVLLHYTKTEKQWSGKFNPKWNGPFHIEEILGNRAYKLRLDNKILTKAAHGNQLKPYHNITLPSTSNIPQLGVQKILVQPEEIS